jgi:urea carboxylase-associated protein 2
MTAPKLDPARIVHQDTLPGARYWSFIIRRGYCLRLTDTEGGANCSALLYNAHEKLERYNMADTLKAQHTAYLTKGHVCYSDMGRVLMSIIDDSCGWHDTFCGVSDAALVKAQYGEHGYQEYRNDFYRNGRELFLIELQKWGLDRRDLVANINFFSRVTADETGRMQFHAGHSSPGSFVDLRAEMDTLVVLNTCPHPLDPAREWRPRPVALAIWRADPVAPDDACLNSCPENRRGFANTAIYHCQYD